RVSTRWFVAQDRPKHVSRLQESPFLLQKGKHRRCRMDPVASARLRKAGAACGAAVAERMILRVLAHPEPEHDPFLGMLGRPGYEQQKPNVGRPAVGIGRGASFTRN